MRRGAFAAGICAAILAFLSIVYFGVIGNLALVVLDFRDDDVPRPCLR